MERWQEEIEILEEEFRRLARACDRMAVVWEGLATLEHSANQGFVAYGHEMSAMYTSMAVKARDLFSQAGGSWPVDGESLEEHVRARRPLMKPESEDY
jgi:hypothetical protein